MKSCVEIPTEITLAAPMPAECNTPELSKSQTFFLSALRVCFIALACAIVLTVRAYWRPEDGPVLEIGSMLLLLVLAGTILGAIAVLVRGGRIGRYLILASFWTTFELLMCLSLVGLPGLRWWESGSGFLLSSLPAIVLGIILATAGVRVWRRHGVRYVALMAVGVDLLGLLSAVLLPAYVLWPIAAGTSIRPMLLAFDEIAIGIATFLVGTELGIAAIYISRGRGIWTILGILAIILSLAAGPCGHTVDNWIVEKHHLILED